MPNMKPKTARTIYKVLAGSVGWAFFAMIFTLNSMAIVGGGLLGIFFLIGPVNTLSSEAHSKSTAVHAGKSLVAILSLIVWIAIGFAPGNQNPWLLRFFVICFMPGIMRLSIKDFGPTVDRLCWGILFGAGITAIGEYLGAGAGRWIGATGGAVWGLLYMKIDTWINGLVPITTTTEATSK